MITLDIDLSYLSKHFGLSSQKIDQYAGKSIEEAVEIEASNGNDKTKNLKDVVNDPEKLVQLLKLMDATNRFLIIRNLNDDDLQALLEYLDSEDLAWGLQYFSIDKLMDLLEELPQEELLRLVLDRFGIENIVALMKNEEMDAFLTNEKVEREDIMNFFEQLDEEQFRKLMFQIMGAQAFEGDRKDIMQQLEGLDDREFKRTIKSFETKGKMLITYGLLYNKPKYLQLLTNETLVRPFGLIEKEKIIESMKKLDPEFLIPMVQELPKDLLQVLTTQIDPSVFAEFLSDNFSDILSEITL